MLGIVCEKDCPELMKTALDHKLLLNVTSGNVVRLLPPLNINEQEAEQIADIVCQLVENL